MKLYETPPNLYLHPTERVDEGYIMLDLNERPELGLQVLDVEFLSDLFNRFSCKSYHLENSMFPTDTDVIDTDIGFMCSPYGEFLLLMERNDVDSIALLILLLIDVL